MKRPQIRIPIINSKLHLLRNLGATALVATSLLIGLPPAQAATENWSGATGGLWGTNTNWSASATPDLTYDLTILGPSDVAGALTINIDAAAAANSINFTDTAAVTLNNTTSGANQTLTLGAGGLTVGTGAVTIGSATANQNVNIALGASQIWNIDTGGLTASNVISDGGSGFGITKSGAGALTLNGANTYRGGTTLDAGTINFSNNASFGTGSITSNGGTLKGAATTANNLVVNGATTLDVTGGNWYLNGNISGSGAITRGASVNMSLYLGGDNSGYTGTFTNPNLANAVLRFNSVNAGSTGASWVFDNTSLGKTTLSWSGTGAISFGSMTGAGQFQTDVAGAKTISVGALGLNDTFSGTIANGTGTIALIKVGSGTMTLSGANTYTGATTISAGTLKLGNNLAIQNSALDTTGAGTMDVTGFTTPTLGGLSGSTDLASVIATGYDGVTALTLNPQTGVTNTYSGVIANGAAGMALTKSGAGTQVLSGANTYSGATNVNAGILQISAANNLGDGSATNTISFNGGTLESTANTYDLGSNRTISLAGNGTIQSDAGTLTVSGGISASSAGNKKLAVQGAGDTVISGAINSGAGAVGLLKLGTGILNLSGGGTLNGSFAGYGVNSGFVIRGGTTKITSGAYSTNLEAIIGGVTVNGETGVNTNLTLDGGSLTVTNWFSLGRGNGVGGVSSDLVLNNNASVTVNNFSAGFNAGSTLNLPKGTVTLNGASSFSVATAGEFHVGESAGSNFTMTLNGSSSVMLNGNAANADRRYIGAGGGTGVVTLNDSATFNDAGTSSFNVGYQNGSGTLNINPGTTFSHTSGEVRVAASNANGTFTGSGTVNVNGGLMDINALTLARNNNNVASTLNGTVNLTSGTVNVRSGQSLVGWMGQGSTGTINISGGAYNQGTTVAANMTIGSFNGAAGSVNVSGGALTLQRNSSIRFSDTAANNPTGTLTISGSGNVSFYNDAGSTVGGTGVVDLMATAATGTNTINLNGGTLTANQIKASSATGTRLINFNGGTLKSGASALASAFLNSGVATTANVRDGGAIIDTNGNSVTIGQILAHSSIAGDSATDGGLTKNGSGTLTLTAANTYTGTTTVSEGTLAVGVNGGISGTVILGVNGGTTGTLDVTAKSSFSEANISGNGTINIGTGKLVTATGNVAPGFGAGTLNVTGDFTLASTAAMALEIGGMTAGTFDVVNTTGAFTYGGSLTVTSLGGFDLTQQSTYGLFTAGSFAGDFTGTVTVNGVALTDNSGIWTGADTNANYTFTDSTGVLEVVAVPEPSTWAMILSGFGLLSFWQRNRRKAA